MRWKKKERYEDLLKKKYENGKKWKICQNPSRQKNLEHSLFKSIKLVAIEKC